MKLILCDLGLFFGLLVCFFLVFAIPFVVCSCCFFWCVSGVLVFWFVIYYTFGLTKWNPKGPAQGDDLISLFQQVS